ncbi:MAG: efflux RND transporter periplasmic adaptor subunit [Pseudomonadota bacterium]
MSLEAAREAGIVVSVAAKNAANETLSLPAELRFDADRVAAISPLVSGRIENLTAREGDTISRGDTLAVLASRELADLKAEYLTAETAETLARQALAREQTLYAEKITSEADLQTATAAFAGARAQREGVENKLHAVGVSDAELSKLSESPDGSLAATRVRAPIGGVIAQRTAMLGASVSADDPGAPALFTIVDDSVLWADIAVYKQDISAVQPGIAVNLVSSTGAMLASGQVALVLPSFDETSRTVTARMIVDNAEGRLRPGQFVTAQIMTGNGALAVMVPAGAIVQVEGRTVVFVPTDDGFEPKQVTEGQQIGDRKVIRSGLAVGERYVSEGAFTLKAQLEKDAFGDGHVH